MSAQHCGRLDDHETHNYIGRKARLALPCVCADDPCTCPDPVQERGPKQLLLCLGRQVRSCEVEMPVKVRL